MPTKQIRDNAYYLDRMRREHPSVHADHVAGRLTARQAIYKVGYQTAPTTLQILLREWRKASPAEKKSFIASIRTATPPTAYRGVGRTVVDADGRLEQWAMKRIKVIMAKRNLVGGDVGLEIGLHHNNQSIAMAIKRNARILDVAVVAGLDRWLARNSHI